MPTWIIGGPFVLCLALLTNLPVYAAEPSFDELLAKAQAESAAGRRWDPPGDNLADTVIALFQLAPTATSQQLAAFSALLERDRKGQLDVPAVAPPSAAAPAARTPAMASPGPPPAVPAPPPAVRLPDAHAVELLARGQEAERSGDITAARRLYASAADRGSAVAARSLGRLYDPAFLGRTVIGGIDADPVEARRWYERATALGDPEAAPLLQSLSAR